MACSEHSRVELEVADLKEKCAGHEKRLASLEGLKLMAYGALLAYGPLCALMAFLWKHPAAIQGIRTVVGGQP